MYRYSWKAIKLLLVLCTLCYALQPEIVFDTTYGGPRVDAIHCMSRTQAGGYLLGGYSNSFENSLSINPWVFQMEHTGETGWFHRYHLPCNSSADVIEEHTDGTIYVAGKTRDPDNGNNSIVLVRAKPDGDTLWQRVLDSEYDYTLRDGIITHDGGLLMVGEADTLIPGEIGSWMICIDSGGNELWKKIWGDSIRDTVQRINSICRFGDEGYAGIGQKNNEIFLLRFNALGDTLWTRTYDWGGLNFPYEMKITRESNFIIAGYRVDQTTFESNIIVACIDSAGNVVWAKEYGYDSVDELSYNVIQTSDGGYLVAGVTIRMIPYSRGAMFLRLNSSGDTLWTMTTMDYVCYDLCEHRENLYVVAGEVRYDVLDSNVSDGWVANIEERDSPIIHVTGPQKKSLNKVSFSGQSVIIDPLSRAYLFTLQGRKILEISPQSRQIITTHFPSGVYLLHYRCNARLYARKLVINN